jgi:ABC-type antimicrobial peptide transport system permease subunit
VVGGFSVLAFLAAIAGVYGLMAFLVSGRLREIGVRIALGASPGDISRLILGSSARLVATGAALGAIAAVTASRWIESALFGITGTDPATYVAVVLLVIISALAATWKPARHASRVDPARMLRAD